jgi:hypothetical protein
MGRIIRMDNPRFLNFGLAESVVWRTRQIRFANSLTATDDRAATETRKWLPNVETLFSAKCCFSVCEDRRSV